MAQVNDSFLEAVMALVNSIKGPPSINFYSLPEYKRVTRELAARHSAIMSEEDASSAVTHEILSCAYPFLTGKDSFDLEGYKEALKQQLIDCETSLPQDYTLRIEVPQFPAVGAFSIELCENVLLTQKNDGNTKTNSLVRALMKEDPWAATEIQIAVRGYGNGFAESPAVSEAVAIARMACFLLQAYGGFQQGWTAATAKARLLPKSRGAEVEVQLDTIVARCFGDLVPAESKWLVYDSRRENAGPIRASNILLDRGRPPETTEEKIEAIRDLAQEALCLMKKKGHEDFESLSAATQWYQDSQYSDNQTFAYLAACIGLEALLGGADGNLDQLSRRLEDRYAFLIGKSRSERELMRQRYKEALSLRGKLVHGRQRRLEASERKMLYAVQGMLWTVISKEMQQLLRA